MKKIFLFVLILISINSLAQNPSNYQYRTVRERLVAMMVDSSFHLPRYNGVPSGMRVGSSYMDGALAVDTLNHNLYLWSNLVWTRLAKYSELLNIYNTSDSITNGDTRLVGIWGGSTSLEFRSKTASTDVEASHFKMNAGSMLLYNRNSSNETYGFSSDYLNTFQFFDNRTTKVGLEYAADYSADYTSRSLVDSAFVGAAIAAIGSGSGTVNTGASGKAAYYPGAGTTVDDFVAVDYATSGTNVLITTQNTTDVGLEIKGVSSQSANLLNISSSSGTGDLSKVTSNGYLRAVRLGAGTDPTNILETSTSSYTTGPKFSSSDAIGSFLQLDATGGGGINWGIGATGTTLGGNDLDFYSFAGSNSAALLSSVGHLRLGNGFSTDLAQLALQPSGTTIDGIAVKAPGSYTGNYLEFTSSSGSDGDILKVGSAGAITANNLAGTGNNRPVVASSAGLLSAPVHTLSKAITIESPSSSEAVDMWQTPVAITVSSLKAILRGSSPSVTYNIRFGTDITSSTDVFTSDITCTSITTGCSNSSGFNDATIPAGSFIWVVTTAASGTINSISLTINYTED